MKIMQINCVYGHGSTGAITAALHEALLAAGHDSVVLYGRGASSADPAVVKVCPEWYAKANRLYSWLSGDRYGGCRRSTRQVLKMIEAKKPDLVHLQCVNGNFVNIPLLVSQLKESGIPTVLTLHAEFMYTANCSHAVECGGWLTGCGNCPRLRQASRSIAPDRTDLFFRRMRDAFAGYGDRIRVVSVSPWLCDRAAVSPILKDLTHTVILNGVDTSVFYPRPEAAQTLPETAGEKLVFHATASFSDAPESLKGGADVIETARRLIGSPVRFMVAGKTDVAGDLPENVTLLGEIRDWAEMARLYTGADVTLLTSRRETFSLPVAESLCCGTPVVGYQAGGPEQIALPAYSAFVPCGDADALERALRTALETPVNRAEIAAEAAARYSTQTMTEAYIALYGSML